ncbi:hypothetical protein FA10DRAFT_265531 [Acaromyces ingoldii]|uniref:Uncharacterized protein n=1 Tax=Acaromyces ingoldii TaxID=215250 RepID=A0A316YVD3_9BASI|nr:hypothetical protein FA10DRAFT_265531 [Acaromyces ingoldii]PWN91685.1 hypothetical protein FA10DRAFT_265531 [Acaromyces ingoldii]
MAFAFVARSSLLRARPFVVATSRTSAAPFSSSTARFVTPGKKETATTSEDAVHAERSDDSVEELQKKTAAEAERQKHQHFSKASPNDQPTDSEDAVHGEKHSVDPLAKSK